MMYHFARVAFLLLLALPACMRSPLPTASSIDDLGPSQVLIVGRVELVPPLEKNEQKLMKMIGADAVRNKLLLVIDERWPRKDGDSSRSSHKRVISAVFGEYFFAISDAKTFYILYGDLWIDAADRVYFPGGLKVTIRPTDKAIYIGTLRYERDEFFHFTRYGILDEYEQARAEYLKKYGDRYPLAKSLAVPVKAAEQ